MFDLTGDGLNWSRRLCALLHCPNFMSQCAPFKGVTDILLVGNKGAVVVLTSLTTKDVETVSSCSGILVAKISIAKPKLVDCKHNAEWLPSKLAELLSSMYLIGIMSSMKEDIFNLHEVSIYSWLMFCGTHSLGVELKLDESGCFVNIYPVMTTMSDQCGIF